MWNFVRSFVCIFCFHQVTMGGWDRVSVWWSEFAVHVKRRIVSRCYDVVVSRLAHAFSFSLFIGRYHCGGRGALISPLLPRPTPGPRLLKELTVATPTCSGGSASWPRRQATANPRAWCGSDAAFCLALAFRRASGGC